MVEKKITKVNQKNNKVDLYNIILLSNSKEINKMFMTSFVDVFEPAINLCTVLVIKF